MTLPVRVLNFQTINEQEYLKHLLRLDGDAKVFRFGGIASDDSIAAFTKKTFSPFHTKHSHHVVGIFVNGSEQPVGHYHVAMNGVAEISLGLEKEYRGLGLGKLILSNAMHLVSSYGYTEFSMDCLKRNEKIVKLVNSLRGEVFYESSGSEIHARVKIKPE